MDELTKEFNDLKESDSKIANTIDNAVEEINKATEFVKETIQNNNTDWRKKTMFYLDNAALHNAEYIMEKFKIF